MKANKNSLEFNPKFNLHKIADRLYCVEMPSMYDLSMLFVRYQEYYESPNPEVRNKAYDLELYKRWYATSKQRRYVLGSDNSFSYTLDFAGFNVPSHVLTDILLDFKYYGSLNVYDYLMKRIYNTIIADIGGEYPFYLIGTQKMKSDVLKHEIAHGFYHLIPEYKETMDNLINTILTPSKIKKFKKSLVQYHYTEEVMYDEMQAYLSTEKNLDGFPEVDMTEFKKFYNKHYKTVKPKLMKKINLELHHDDKRIPGLGC